LRILVQEAEEDADEADEEAEKKRKEEEEEKRKKKEEQEQLRKEKEFLDSNVPQPLEIEKKPKGRIIPSRVFEGLNLGKERNGFLL
jgi:hypothetical protein